MSIVTSPSTFVPLSKQYKAHVDQHHLVAPTFAVGGMVWLLRHHIATTHPYAKLDYKKVGPFCILKRVNPIAFRLALPPKFQLQNFFHVSLLKLYHRFRIQGHQPPPPPPMELLTWEEYKVDRILDSHLRRQRFQYVVLWKGYPLSDATWELVTHLQNNPETTQAFHQQYPHKPTVGVRR